MLPILNKGEVYIQRKKTYLKNKPKRTASAAAYFYLFGESVLDSVQVK